MAVGLDNDRDSEKITLGSNERIGANRGLSRSLRSWSGNSALDFVEEVESLAV